MVHDPTKRAVVWCSMAWCCLVLAACSEALSQGEDGGGSEPLPQKEAVTPVDSVGLEPDIVELAPGRSTRLQLYVRDASGRVLDPGEYDARWESDREDVVRVDPDGQLHAVATGLARVYAFVRGVRGWAQVEVRRLVERVEILAPERAIVPGELVSLKARVIAEDGAELDGASVRWSIVETDRASLKQGGRLRALKPGEVTVTATFDGVSTRETLTIGAYEVRGIRFRGLEERLAVGSARRLRPLALGADDYPLDHLPVRVVAQDEHADVVDLDLVEGRRAGIASLEASVAGHVERRELLIYEPFVALDAGWAHACALDAVGRAFCWGANTSGELGSRVDDSLGRPVLVSESLRFAEISAGSFHSCGVTTTGELYCWGANEGGKLGDGAEQARWEPVRVGVEVTWASVSAGTLHTCGLSVQGQAWCWGVNELGGRLGTGAIGTSGFPQAVAGGHVFSHLSAGLNHTCAVEAVGQAAWCWGNNEYLQLGRAAAETQTEDGLQLSRVPLVVGGGHRYVEVFAAGAHGFSCGLTVDEQVLCWGNNRRGALLEGGSDYPMSEQRAPQQSARPVPVHEDARAYAALDVGAHACGIRRGDIYCWTDGFHASSAHPYLPPPRQFASEKLPALASFEAVAAGQAFTCGISTEGELYCGGAEYQRFAQMQGFTPSTRRLYRLHLPALAEYEGW